MQVAKISSDNKIDQIGELKVLFPNTSFPANGPNSDWYTENNVMSVTVGLSFDHSKQKQEQVDPYISDGVVYTVKLVDLTNDEKTAYTNAQNATIAARQRASRDALLAETDWMASNDYTMSDEWKTYRQALRDLPSQSGFPDVDFPTKPS